MRLPVAALLIGGALGQGGAAVAEAAETLADTPAGMAIYSRYCATCHGSAAQGDGPTAGIITIPPTDLSGLASANGGTFPVARVIRRIDGREQVLAHGTPMPVYGAFFEGGPQVQIETDEGTIAVSRPVLEIVDYLRALQQ